MTTTFAAPAVSSSVHLQQIVRRAAEASPRNQQVAVGPSEMGDECDRRLAYRALDVKGPNTSGDPWPSIVGVAVHGWLADAFTLENQRLGRVRYLIEQRVFMTDGISGTCDLFDVDQAEVIDHKILGTTSMKKIKSGDIAARYQVQLQLYGFGLRRAGRRVERVSLACYPRGGFLDGLYVWSTDYDEATALAALARFSNISAAALVLNLDDPSTSFWGMIPAQPTPERCAWCPYWRPGRPADFTGCPGPT